jgi:DNA-directed RNA polymerase specialized sigma24 family protein
MCELATQAAQTGDFSDELVEMFYVLSRRMLNLDAQAIRKRFDFLDADDLVQEAVVRCFQVTLNFDETRLKMKQATYFFFRAIIIQTYLRLHTWHTRQKRTPEHGIISLNTSKSSRVHDHLDRCNRKEYLGAGSEDFHDDFEDYFDFAEKAISEIRRQCACGATLAEIAREYDVDETVVQELLDRSKS